ncbi:MAG: DUF4012 domain-containing protein [Patescibacteria group bacterium]|nr:DUF4012 domain-containing protein [Patescibacteria group bacterium]
MKKHRKNVLSQMFDIKPVDKDGDVDMEKILSIPNVISLKKTAVNKQFLRGSMPQEPKTRDSRNKNEAFPHSHIDEKVEKWMRSAEKIKKSKAILKGKARKSAGKKKKGKRAFLPPLFSNYRKIQALQGGRFQCIGKPAFSFAAIAIMMTISFTGLIYVSYGFQIKNDVQVLGEQAIGHLELAKQEMKQKDFNSANANFEKAVLSFAQAQEQIDKIGGDMLDIFSELPILSKISSGKNVISAGNDLTMSAKELSAATALLSASDDSLGGEQGSPISLIDVFLKVDKHVLKGEEHLENARSHVEKVRIEDLPAEYQEKFRKAKQVIPVAISAIEIFHQHSEIFLELLGNNGSRKYLLLFQNNQEIRPTGGFIGSYGLLSISNGNVKKFIIDGIFNPDGQFREDIIPPRPLQKVTAGWSTHDANWFPHFPASAEKIASFYEKTGGPTVDGIITMTPTVMEKMLEVTGPIRMDEYEMIIDSDNFIRETQYEVEENYDREENQPKKFLADLAPEILNRLFNVSDAASVSKAVIALSGALKEKQILLYSFEDSVQEVISKRGWSGEIRQTKGDFLMVVNTNINGYKTDGVIDETISHKAEIMPDGTIINTVSIRRTHNGGDADYEWWNKVNSDYMRVYVPKGSELILVSGQTRELIEPPLDYEKLGFKTDPDIAREEENMIIDEKTGTRVYEEEEKTVFANWVYVSPKETAEIEYVYRLPFKIDLNKNNERPDTYSLLVQKQSGSIGSEFGSTVEFSDGNDVVWKYPDNIEIHNENTLFKTKLAEDKFIGIVLQKK